jgi:serine/threonine protein kinase
VSNPKRSDFKKDSRRSSLEYTSFLKSGGARENKEATIVFSRLRNMNAGIPQTVIAGRYRIEREIGRGGMGTVFRATHLGLARPVAVKILKSEFAASAEVTERFMREARTMARLRHSRSAIIFDAGKLDDNRPFIVMEYVEGMTLAEAIAREGRFEPERAVKVASEICEVLAEAHKVGIVHRDLKPSNIMLTERGVVVLDFGIAKILQTTAETTLAHTTTDSGLIIGTPRYMSPEQCVGHSVGPASDLYSVGVLLYEMLAGRPPFVDVLQSAVLVKQATAAAPLLLALCPDVPRPLALATHTLLAKNPAHRPASAHDARVMLQKSIAKEATVTSEFNDDELLFSTATFMTHTNRFALHRIAATLLILAICGASLFVLGRGIGGADGMLAFGGVSSYSGGGARSMLSSNEGTRPSTELNISAARETLSLDAARMLAAYASHGSAREVNVLRMPRGGAGVVAINRRPQRAGRTGAAYLFVMERGENARWSVTRRAPLDTEDFRGTEWTTEIIDADADGFDETLCAGRRMSDGTRRFVLYVPQTRQSYTLEVAPDRNGRSNTLRAVWSANARTPEAAPFRAVLQARALTNEAERDNQQRSF